MKTFDAYEIVDWLVKAGVDYDNIIALDATYTIPQSGWVRGVFTNDFKERLRQLGMLYEVDREDCDDFAREAWCHACEAHGLFSDAKAGLAFGLFFYFTHRGEYHAINFFASQNGIEFYEPQLQRIITLTEGEIKSCSHAIF